MNIQDLEKALEQLEQEVKEKIKKIGNNEASRQIGFNRSYLSRFMTGKQSLSARQLIEIYKKLF
jgi:hypothetical protein